jgi:hypothetical protein
MEMLEEMLLCRDIAEKINLQTPSIEALNNNIDYIINRK